MISATQRRPATGLFAVAQRRRGPVGCDNGYMRRTRAPLLPANPERVCWGCEKYCPADDLACGNGTIRTMHPCELFGDDWLTWSSRDRRTPAPASDHPVAAPAADATDADQEPE
jgi:hypothetical protein